MRSIIAALILTVVIAPSAMAHGGGLDSDGGHNCYVCIPQEYHYHDYRTKPKPVIEGPNVGTNQNFSSDWKRWRSTVILPGTSEYRKYREAHNERRRKEIAAAVRRSISSSAQIVK